MKIVLLLSTFLIIHVRISRLSKLVCQRSYDSKGVYCRELIDLFESKSCHNNGQCQRGKDNYKWHFSLNHIGKRYDIYQTPCFAQPYRNNERYFDRNNTNER